MLYSAFFFKPGDEETCTCEESTGTDSHWYTMDAFSHTPLNCQLQYLHTAGLQMKYATGPRIYTSTDI